MAVFIEQRFLKTICLTYCISIKYFIFNIFSLVFLNKKDNFSWVTNQVEISPAQLEHFKNGKMAYFLQKEIHPMAWSSLAGGRLLHPQDEVDRRIHYKLSELAQRKGTESIAALVYAWLLKHPAGIIPVLGTGKLHRIQEALNAFNISLSTEEWFEIYEMALGHRVP